MTQYKEIDGFNNITGYTTTDTMPERDGFTYVLQDPPVTNFPPAPYRKAVLKYIDGQNVWIDNRTYDERCEDIRSLRDEKFKLSDRVAIESFRKGLTMPTAWSTYAQALADITDQTGFPDELTWPTVPS